MKKLFSFLCLLVLGMGMSVQAQLVIKWGDPDNYTLTSDLVDGFGHSQYYSDNVYYWEDASTSQFIRIEGIDRNKTSDMLNGNAICLFIKVTGTRTYSDGAGGTVVGPRVNTEGYPVEVPTFSYWNVSEENSAGNTYYGTFSTAADECTVGYKTVSGYYSNGGTSICNLSSRFHESDGFGLWSITSGKVTVEEGKNGTMFVKLYHSSGKLQCIIGEEQPKDGLITAVSNDNNRGTVSGTVVGSGANFVSGTTYNGGTEITLNANALSGYTFLKWNEDSNTENPRTITVNGNATYTAVFTPTRTITVTPDDALHGSASGSGTYAEGATVTISASGLNGYAFTQWNDHNTENPRTITVGNADASYTAEFVLPGMTVGNCSNSADIFSRFDYSNVTNTVVEQWDNGGYFLDDETYTVPVSKITARNANNDKLCLYITYPIEGGEFITSNYQGGECTSLLTDAPPAGTYNIEYPDIYSSCYNYWYIPGNQKAVAFNSSHNSDWSCTSVSLHCDIVMEGDEDNQHWDFNAGGSLIISENNVGGLFIETNNVYEDANNQSVYFTLGNRSENTVNLGKGTMSVTSNSLTMSAAMSDERGNHSATIKLNNNTTGSKTISNSDFDISSCIVVFGDNSVSDISTMTGNLTRDNNGVYTLTLNIRDCAQNVYTITMSADAPTFNLTWDANGKSITGGTASGSVQFGSSITAPSSNTVGYNLTGWSPSVPATMPAEDATYTAQWSIINYTISYSNLNNASNSNPVSYNVESGDIALVAPGTRTGYTFANWTDDDNNDAVVEMITGGTTGNRHFTANWTANKYAVTFYGEDGTTVLQSSDVDYDTHPVYGGSTDKAPTAQYTYTFTGWNDGTNTYTGTLPAVTGTASYTATYSSTVNKYTVTWQDYDGTELEKDLNVEYGETPSYDGVDPTRAEDESFSYTFAGWDGDITAAVTDDITFTATYTSQAKAFVLKDGYTEEDKNNGNDDNFYSTLASIAEAGQPVESVTYERNFKPNTWSVFALPFNYVLAESGHAFEGDVYGLTSVEYDAANNYLSLFFFPETTILYANRPYLYYSSTGVTNPVFQNVTMTELTTNYYSVTNNGTYGGKVSFRNTMYKQRLDNDSHIVFINNNTLYYMGTNNVYMRAFRGYFYMDGFNINTGVAPRVRIVLNGQTATELEMVNDMPAAENGVRKYMENGTLVIEREGVKYNATGSKIN